MEESKIYMFEINDKNNRLIEIDTFECDIKSAIRQVVRIFFEQEVTADNDMMTAIIYRVRKVSDGDNIKVAELSFNALQLEDGKIRYEIILTDQYNINHDYRGNMK